MRPAQNNENSCFFILLHDQWLGHAVKFINRDWPETADEGDDIHLPDENVGVVFESDGDVAEVLIAPSLFDDGMSFG